MANHKWKDTSDQHQKTGVCTKCGIERYWLYGYMQCWEYLDLRTPIGVTRTTVIRPDCEPERKFHQGFHENGQQLNKP